MKQIYWSDEERTGHDRPIRLAVVGSDRAVTDVLLSEIAASPDVGDASVVRPGDDLGVLDDHDVLVVVPGELRGLPDVETADRVCSAGRGAAHVILISSAEVNEPSHHHPCLTSEDRLAPLRRAPLRRRNVVAAGWRELEERARATFEGTGTVLTVLRPTALVIPGAGNAWSRYFGRGWACTVMGFDPTLQILRGEDLATAVRQVVEHRPRKGSVYNVAPDGGVPVRQALCAARRRRLAFPMWKLRLWSRLTGQPAGRLEYLRYPWTVSDRALRRDLGWKPAPSETEAFDPFGLDPDYIARLSKVFFRFLHDVWWRVEWKGLEHVPRQGRAVLTGVHRGHQPWDGAMTMYYLTRQIGRTPRFLIHPTLVKFPFLAPYITKIGGIPACRENAAWVLERDEILGIFPEGIRGAFRMYRDVYKLGRFGRDEFVKMALRHQAPIVPYVIVGPAEAFPIFGRIDWKWWKRHAEWPFLPITPTMSTVPLPSKWHAEVLEPLHVEERYPPEAADDRAVVRALSQEVRERLEASMNGMLRRRKSVFYGSVFGA